MIIDGFSSLDFSGCSISYISFQLSSINRFPVPADCPCKVHLWFQREAGGIVGPSYANMYSYKEFFACLANPMARGWRPNGCFPSECIEDAFLTCEPSSLPAPRVPTVFVFQLTILQQTHLFLRFAVKRVLGFVGCSVFKYSWTCLRMEWLHKR